MSYALGIDFGTTFSAAVVQRTGNTHVVTLGNRSGAVPSVLLVRPDATLLFGEEAALRGVGEPGRLLANLKRRLGDPGPVVVEHHAFRADELVGEYIRWIVDRVHEREGGPADVIAIGYPANWGAHRTEAFHAALAYVGLEDSALVTEPHAAALFHAGAHEVGPGERLAVYDLGGGTFDAAVLRRTGDGFELVGDPEGVEHLGGLDFDEALLHLVRARSAEAWANAQRQGGSGSAAAAAALRRECVAAKEILSAEHRVSVPILLPGVDPVEVERSAFEVMIRPAIEESLGAFRRALRSAGVTPADLAAVLLVGGSSRIPLVRNLVKAEVAGTMLLDSDPRYAVARGVAAFAALATAHDREGVAREPVAAGMATSIAPTQRVPGGVESDHAERQVGGGAEDEGSAPSTNGFGGVADGGRNLGERRGDGEGSSAGSSAMDTRSPQAEGAAAQLPPTQVRATDVPLADVPLADVPTPEGAEPNARDAEQVELDDSAPNPWATDSVIEPFVMLSRRDRKRQARANRRRRSRIRALLVVLILIIVAVAVLVAARSAAGATLKGQREAPAGRAAPAGQLQPPAA